ncbi:hypothetical protein H072_9555 [Dactylellina haptotyla CBS 200.50]|uniref:Uncharacterized protein n=1 Tax=Dactylellina haptotyla (strain CBS 200.50) TaxID=1284197 RepID=S8A6Z9_DACHA|nr:hypothetical protein H072_9555 [Dactylellina haptotyla CBS 200.50]
MAPRERLAAGSIFFAYQERPKISTSGMVNGSTKDVVDMHWLNADDLAVQVETGPDAPTSITLAPFMAISLHENHLIGLPIVKIPYTMTFNKTCERAERVDRTYLAITPTENTVRLKSKRFDTRYRPLENTDFPPQKIYKDPKTGKPMPEWDALIDLALPVIIQNDNIEWHAEMYKAPVAEVIRLIRLYRFVNGLDIDIPDTEELDNDGEPLDLEDRDRTQRRPVELIGPGVCRPKQKKEITPPSRDSGKQNFSTKVIIKPAKPDPAPIAQPKIMNPTVPNIKPVDKPAQPAHQPTQSTWANIASKGNGQSSIQQGTTVAQPSHNHPEQGGYRGGQQWNNRGGGHNNGGRGRRGRGGRHNANRNGNFGQQNGQQAGPSAGRNQKQTDSGNKQPEIQAPNKAVNAEQKTQFPLNGQLAGLLKEAFITAKHIPDIGKEEPAPTEEIMALAREKELAAQRAIDARKAAQKKLDLNAKDQYNFAAFVRARDKKAPKLESPADDKDSAQAISDNDRTTWNKPDCGLVQEEWPQDWYKLKPGETMIEGVKEVPTREGWEFQAPNPPFWDLCQEWLGIEEKYRRYKNWDS